MIPRKRIALTYEVLVLIQTVFTHEPVAGRAFHHHSPSFGDHRRTVLGSIQDPLHSLYNLFPNKSSPSISTLPQLNTHGQNAQENTNNRRGSSLHSLYNLFPNKPSESSSTVPTLPNMAKMHNGMLMTCEGIEDKPGDGRAQVLDIESRCHAAW